MDARRPSTSRRSMQRIPRATSPRTCRRASCATTCIGQRKRAADRRRTGADAGALSRKRCRPARSACRRGWSTCPAHTRRRRRSIELREGRREVRRHLHQPHPQRRRRPPAGRGGGDRDRREGRLPGADLAPQGAGPGAYGLTKQTLPFIAAARARGVDVTIDVYPYVASSSSLAAMFRVGREAAFDGVAGDHRQREVQQGEVRGPVHPRHRRRSRPADRRRDRARSCTTRRTRRA